MTTSHRTHGGAGGPHALALALLALHTLSACTFQANSIQPERPVDGVAAAQGGKLLPPPLPPRPPNETLGSMLALPHEGEPLPPVFQGVWRSAKAGWPAESKLAGRDVALVSGSEIQLFDGTRAVVSKWTFGTSLLWVGASISMETSAPVPWNRLRLARKHGAPPSVWTVSSSVELGSVTIDNALQGELAIAEGALETLRVLAASSPLCHSLADAEERLATAERALAALERRHVLMQLTQEVNTLTETVQRRLEPLREDIALITAGAEVYAVAQRRKDYSQDKSKLEARLLAIAVMSEPPEKVQQLLESGQNPVLPENLLLLAMERWIGSKKRLSGGEVLLADPLRDLVTVLVALGVPIDAASSLHDSRAVFERKTWEPVLRQMLDEAKHTVTTGQIHANVAKALPTDRAQLVKRFACMGISAVYLAQHLAIDDVAGNGNAQFFAQALRDHGLANYECPHTYKGG